MYFFKLKIIMSYKINQNIIKFLCDNKHNLYKSNEINLSMKKKNKSMLSSKTSTIQDELDLNISPLVSDYSSISKGKKMINKCVTKRKDEIININESNNNKIDSCQKFKFKNNKSHSLKSVFDTLNNNFKNCLNYKINNFSHRNLNLKNIFSINKEEHLNIMKIRLNYFSKFNNEIEKLDKILNNYFNIFEQNIIEEKYNNLQKKRKNGIDILGKIIFDIDFIEKNKPIDYYSLKQIFQYQDEIFSSTNQIFEFLLNEIRTLKTSLVKLKVNMKNEKLLSFPKIKLNEYNNIKIKDLKNQENENKFKFVIYNYQDEIEHLTKLLDKNKEYYNKYNNTVDLLIKKNTEIKKMKNKEKDEYFKNQSIIENYKDKISELENEIYKNKNDFSIYSDKNLKEKSILLNQINELKEENNQLSELLLMKEEELNTYILKYFNQKDIIKELNIIIEFLKNTK